MSDVIEKFINKALDYKYKAKNKFLEDTLRHMSDLEKRKVTFEVRSTDIVFKEVWILRKGDQILGRMEYVYKDK